MEDEDIEIVTVNDDDPEIVEALVQQMLASIGDTPSRTGLIDTPTRVRKMWKEMYYGYDKSRAPKITVFPNNEDGMSYDQMIFDSGYFFSSCEHHMVPFFGQYYFAYIPNKDILGLSKVARVVDYCSAKLQVQERLTKEIADTLEGPLNPLGIAVVIKGRHLCKEMRGVKKINGQMITSDLRGVFRDKLEVREEFMRFISMNHGTE